MSWRWQREREQEPEWLLQLWAQLRLMQGPPAVVSMWLMEWLRPQQGAVFFGLAACASGQTSEIANNPVTAQRDRVLGATHADICSGLTAMVGGLKGALHAFAVGAVPPGKHHFPAPEQNQTSPSSIRSDMMIFQVSHHSKSMIPRADICV